MTTLLLGAVVGIMFAPPPDMVDGKTVVNLLESIQPQLEDYRCEFGGTDVVLVDSVKNKLKLKEDGLVDSFGGVFIWKTNGDTYLSVYHREEPEGLVHVEQLAVRMAKHEAETYFGNIDEPTGEGIIEDPDIETSNKSGSFGMIFVLDDIRRLASSENFYCTMADETLDGRPVKVISFKFHEPDQLYRRFWIDLKRGGHAVRQESYGQGGALSVRINTKLASFQAGNTDIWMPIFATAESHSDEKEGKTIYSEAVTSIETIYIIHGTLEFNKHPGPQTFKLAYKRGTPISDNLRKLKFEFGQQKLPPLPSRGEATVMLKTQVAEAEAQRTELIAGSPARDGGGWASWLTPALAVSALIGSFVLLIQRRRH